MRNLTRLVVFLVLVATITVFQAAAVVSTPSIFGNHMVLQEGKTLPVWGKADPGEEVTVTLGNVHKTTIACPKGMWMVKLPKQKAGKTLEMTIKGKSNTLTFTDVLVGEVWIGSGQSNMDMNVGSSANADEEIANAKYPEIRLFSVDYVVAGEPQDNVKGEWVICSPDTIKYFSAALYFFGRDLHKELKTPVGLIKTAWGGTPAESWTTLPTLKSDPGLNAIVQRWDKAIADWPQTQKAYEETLAQWQKEADKAKAEGKPEPKKPDAPGDPATNPWRPAGLFNAMINPLVPYAIQGAIWYQGESNAGRAYQYRRLFPMMIEDWRRVWNQGPFSFYFVQLANFTERKSDPGPSDWAELREAQTMTLSLKNTGMAVIIDIGDAADIHPKNKQDVGKRLALNALAKDYGRKIPYSGPMYKSMKISGNKVTLTFDHTDGGLVAKGGALKGFAIAGEDQNFVWAEATIKGNKVIVSSDKVAKPVAVRYAWANNPECNLYNGAGLPASPFRTDDWKGVTEGKE